MRIVLHIGTEKTATTAIQVTLWKHAELLGKSGILYSRNLCGENHRCLPACAIGLENNDPIIVGAYNFVRQKGYEDVSTYVLDTLRREISSNSTDVLLLSNEHLHSRIDDIEQVSRLRGILSKLSEEIEVVVYLRRQDRLAISAYSTAYKSGKEKIGPPLPDVNEEIPLYYDYDRLLTMWSDVFGRDHITIRVFEEEIQSANGIVNSFLTAAKLDPHIRIDENIIINESISMEAIVFLSEFNKIVGRVRSKFEEAHTLRAPIVSFLEKTYPSNRKPASKADAMRFYDKFKNINEAVVARFLSGRLSLFDDNFDEYVEDYAQALDVAKIGEIGAEVALWQMTKRRP